jgi:hypothetical protein
VSYQVDKRSEVRERLEEIEREHGYDSVADIRRGHGSRRRKIAHAGEAANLGLAADAAPGQFAADYAALRTALAALTGQIAEVEKLIVEAAMLAQEPMRDGHGPIAHAMSNAFREVADDAEGAVRALTAYRDELRDLAASIQNTMALYERIDTELASHLNTTGEQHV